MLVKCTMNTQANVFVYTKQIECAVKIKNALSGLGSVMGSRLSVSVMSATLLHSLLRSMVANLPDGYTLFTLLNLMTAACAMEVTVFPEHHILWLLLTVPFKTLDRTCILYRLVTLPDKKFMEFCTADDEFILLAFWLF